MEEENQEKYLKETPLVLGENSIVLRGLKKMVTECSSIKSLAMASIVGLLYFGKLDSFAGVIGLLVLIGAKEIDFNQVIEIIKSRIVK